MHTQVALEPLVTTPPGIDDTRGLARPLELAQAKSLQKLIESLGSAVVEATVFLVRPAM